jgi:hypothetical protein
MSEELEKMVFPQRVQKAFEETTQNFRIQKVKVEALALLIKNGTIRKEDLEQAHKRASQIAEAEQREKQRRNEESEKIRRMQMQPDMRIPILARSFETQPENLREYCESYPLNPLLNYVQDLKKRTLHYISQYPTGRMQEIIAFIERALERRTGKPITTKEYIEAEKELSEAKAAYKNVSEKLEEVQKSTKELKQTFEGNPERANEYRR